MEGGSSVLLKSSLILLSLLNAFPSHFISCFNKFISLKHPLHPISSLSKAVNVSSLFMAVQMKEKRRELTNGPGSLASILLMRD